MTPTRRSLAHLRALGWFVAVVERWVPQARRRADVFAFGDLLACHPQGKPTLIQTTTGSNVAARITKAREHAGPLTAWLLSGGRLIVHGWAKRGPRGDAKRWTVREIELTLGDLALPAAEEAKPCAT